MIPCELDDSKHKEEIQKNKSQLIEEIILQLTEIYQRLHGISPYEINCGLCEEFANEVCDLLPGAIADWGDAFTNENDNSDQYAYHCIIKYNDKFYDSEHPNGVKDFREISAFKEK